MSTHIDWIRFRLIHFHLSHVQKRRLMISGGIVGTACVSLLFPEMAHVNVVSATVVNLVWLWE